MTAPQKYLAIGPSNLRRLRAPASGPHRHGRCSTNAHTSRSPARRHRLAITYDRGSSAKRTTVCRAYLDDRRLNTRCPALRTPKAAAAREAAPPAITSLTLRGDR